MRLPFALRHPFDALALWIARTETEEIKHRFKIRARCAPPQSGARGDSTPGAVPGRVLSPQTIDELRDRVAWVDFTLQHPELVDIRLGEDWG